MVLANEVDSELNRTNDVRFDWGIWKGERKRDKGDCTAGYHWFTPRASKLLENTSLGVKSIAQCI